MMDSTSDSWRRFSEARHNSAVLAGSSVLFIILGARVISTSFEPWSGAYLAAVVVVGAACFGLFKLADSEWKRAAHIKRMAEIEGIAAATFTTIMATTVLTALQSALEEAEKTNKGEGGSNEV